MRKNTINDWLIIEELPPNKWKQRVVKAKCAKCDFVIEKIIFKTLKNRQCNSCNKKMFLQECKLKYNNLIKADWLILDIKVCYEKREYNKNFVLILAEAQCLICKKVYTRHLASILSGASSCCNSCSKKKLQGPCSPNWKGNFIISARLFNQIKSSAKKRSLEFNLSIEDLEKLFLSQNGKCKLSGITLRLPNTTKDAKVHFRKGISDLASLDRIDPNFGYTLDNVMWLSATVNMMKNTLQIDDFIDIVKKIAEFNK